MPRKSICPKPGTRRYGTKSNYTAVALETALDKIRSCSMSQREASKVYNVPRSTLKYKLKQHHDKNVGRPPALTTEEENSFIRHIVALGDLGIPVGLQDLRLLVKRYLDKHDKNIPTFKNNLPGWEWGKLFLERHPEIKQRFAHNISRKRAQVDKEKIDNFFDCLSTELDGLPPENIYNFDETGFHDNPKKAKLLFRRECRNPEIIQNSTKSCYTVMFCGNAAGEMLPPFIILKGLQKWSDWLTGAPKGTRMAVTKSGWIDADTFDEWFENHFLPNISRKEGPKALIGDNLSSHVTQKTLKLCEENNIKFICLIPNSTHLLQPLDVAYFSSLKTHWRAVLSEWRKTRRGKIAIALPKNIFAQLLNRTLEVGKPTVQKNLQEGFKASGLYPCDRDVVLKKLPNYGKPVEELNESVGESFKEYMSEIRTADLGTAQRRKFQIPITAGKSISAEQVEEFYRAREEQAKNKPVKGAKRGRPMGSKNKKENAKRKMTNRDMSRQLSGPVDSSLSPQTSTLVSEVNDAQQLSVSIRSVTPQPSTSGMQKTNTKLHNDTELHRNYSSSSDEENEPPNGQNSDVLLPPSFFEEYEVNEGILEPTETVELATGIVCIIRYEGSLFPGKIIKAQYPNFSIALMQKTMDGWKCPTKTDIIKCTNEEIIQALSWNKIQKKNGIYIIENDLLFMEWGE